MVCKEYPYGLIYKKNFKFLGRTVSEKSAMLISRYHRIFLEKCATEEHEIWFARSIHMGYYAKKNFKFLGRTVSEKSAMLISSYHRIFLEKCATEEHEIWFTKSIHMG